MFIIFSFGERLLNHQVSVVNALQVKCTLSGTTGAQRLAQVACRSQIGLGESRPQFLSTYLLVFFLDVECGYGLEMRVRTLREALQVSLGYQSTLPRGCRMTEGGLSVFWLRPSMHLRPININQQPACISAVAKCGVLASVTK